VTAADIARAKLYARSAAYAEAQGNPKLAATFTRRGIAIAGDHWPHLYADRDRDGVSNQPPEAPPAAAEKPTKGKRENAAALAVRCPECQRGPGVKCTNYTGATCAPHSARKALAEDASRAANQD
jgi:hypothetical protein